MAPSDIKKLSDSELIERTEKVVLQEREMTNSVLDHLREIESRRLYARLGYSSMFDYCTKHLKYCNASAQLRIDAMRLAVELPEIKESLENGSLNLSVIGSFQKFVRHEKQRKKSYSTREKKELLKQVETKSRLEAEKILAKISPEAFPQEKMRVLNETQSELRFVADEELLELMSQMKAKLRQKGNTDPSYLDIIKAGLRKALKVTSPKEVKDEVTKKDKLERAHVSSTSPDEVMPSEQSQIGRVYITVSKKKMAFIRANEQCTFISPLTGKRCTEKYFLQVEHIVPVAMGGSSEQENLTFLCACHNRLNAIDSYGMEKMQPYLRF